MKGIIIGRFQGFHNGHRDLILSALRHLKKEGDWNKELEIYIGSAQESRTKKNPFTFFERKSVILDVIQPTDCKLVVKPLWDMPGNDKGWLAQIPRLSHDILFGNLKDESSYYLNLFTDIHLVSFPQTLGLSATRVREMFYEGNFEKFTLFAPEKTLTFLQQFIQLHPEEYKKLCE